MMRELLQEDYEKLKSTYLGGSFSEMKTVYHKLRKIKEELRLGTVNFKGEKDIVCSDLGCFFNWVQESFPNMLEYLQEDSIPDVFNENDFPKFKKTHIEAKEIANIRIQRIKKLEIWGEQQKIKQNYQKVEEISFKEDVATFYLSNDAFLQIWNPIFLYDSDYNLQIKSATKIVLAFAGKEVIEYVLNNNKLQIKSNKKEDVTIGCSSVFIEALEIIK